MRIGIATARGLAVSTGLPARGVCTLDALARGIHEPGASAVPLPDIAGQRNSAGGETGGGGAALAVLDGWRGEVFAALYGSDGARLWEPAVYRPEALAARLAELGEEVRAAGSGALRFRQELTRDGVRIADDSDPVHRVAARHVCAIAAAAGAADRDGLAPIYLRPPDAERWRERNSFQKDQ